MHNRSRGDLHLPGTTCPQEPKLFFCFLGLRFEKGAQKFFMHTMHNRSRGDLHLPGTTCHQKPKLFFFVFWD
jgi:hypothetical protein